MPSNPPAPRSRLGHWINEFEETAIAVLLGLMTLITFANVVLRYGFNTGLIWGLEATTFLFAWLVLFGVSYAVKVTAHLGEAGGKRMRPMLTLATARMCGYSGPYHIHLAATVEFIHTATLLHDDVVDDSAQRRGRPTANLLWDNQSSVFVGDYLFSLSFQLMVDTGRLRVLDILSNASATISEG